MVHKIKSPISIIFKTFLLSLTIISQVHFAYAQTSASILPPAKTTFFDQNGNPLTSGKVFSYIPNTLTPKTTWQDAAETIPNLNPVVLDAAGRALILGSGNYRQQVYDRNNNLQWDQVTSSTGSGGGTGPIATGDGDLVGTIKPWAGMTAPNQYVFTYGQELSRTLFPALFTAITSAQPVFCNSGSPILNGLGDTNNFWIGMSIEVACLGAGFSTIISKTGTTVTMAANANVTQNTTATFFPWGRGNGTTTFNLPDLRGNVLAGNTSMGGTISTNLIASYFSSKGPNSIGATGGSQFNISQLNNIPSGITTTGTVSFGGNLPTTGATIGSLATNAGAGPATVPVNNSGWAGVASVSATLTSNNTGNGSAVSATVAAGGSGYTTGTQLLTVTGGTCSVAPQFNVVGAAGAITTPTLVERGVCTVFPSNPVSTTGGGGTGGTLTITASPAPISTIQPTITTNFIIKVTPDQNSATASGVTSLGLMTGDIACGAGLLCTGNNISVSNIPAATNVTLGGVLSSTCASSNWFNSLGNGTGIFACTQPNFTDLAGSIAIGQIPNSLITYAKIQNGTGLSLIGVAGNVAAANADIVAALDNQVMRRLGTSLAFGSIDLSQTNTVGSSILALANGGCNAALTASNGGILWSNATQCQILAGTATARLPLVSGATATPAWGAFQLPASVTSGGVLCFTSTTVSASSVLQTANAIMLGGGAGVCPSPLGSLGTTTTVLHGNAAGAPTFGAVAISTDVSGLGTGVATALGTTLSAAGGVTSTIASGTSAMGTGAIASATCATVVTTAATNTATTDVVTASFNGDPTAVTGYIPATTGMLTIIAYPTANNVNFKVCNNTLSSITPGAITLNWRVVR